MKALGRWLVPVVAIAGSLALAAGAYLWAQDAWNGVVEYESPYARAPLPASETSAAVASRVVFVIVDGLRLDASRRMSSLESLRDYGADYTLSAPQPTLSYPNWTTILTGTNQDVHGVVTNWHEGAAPVENLLDCADREGVPYVVVGPSDIATLYPAATRADGVFFRDWSDEYLSGTYVDETIRLVEQKQPRVVLLHLPDIDEAGHDFGGSSTEYAQTVARVDSDIRRLVEALQDTRTTFAIVADHGHIDTGGHGGWEPEVAFVPGVLSGAGVRVHEGTARLEDMAPTVAVLAGIPVPRYATGGPLESALATTAAQNVRHAWAQRFAAVTEFARIVRGDAAPGGEPLPDGAHGAAVTRHLDEARAARLAADRRIRLNGTARDLLIASALSLLFVGVASWRALLAALSGSAAYYALYNGLFFLVHGNRWSLSAFNSEELVDAWMNTRLLEAAVAGVFAAGVAAFVYPLLRRSPKGPRGTYLAGWLGLGPVTVAVTQLTLAIQVAWFIYAWGIVPEWGMPDLMWGFKFDLDLMQVTALGAAALLSPVVSYLVGRYHPKTRILPPREA